MLSVDGKINGSVQSNLGGDTGSVQICKQTSQAGGTDISNRYYRFTVSGGPALVEVFVPPTPVGSTTGLSVGCSAPFDVTAGPQTITELGEARLPGETAPGSFTNFQLINVEQLNPPPPSPAGASSLGAVNLGTRVAGITVVAGGQEGVLVTRFTNVFAITGFVEICKERATGPTLGTAGTGFGFPAGTFNPNGDIDVTGTFEFTVEGVYSLNRINAPGTSPAVTRTYQVFPVSVGQCSGPIAVTISNPSPTTTTPRESIVRVTEIARPGFFLESVTTRPCDREIQDFENDGPSPLQSAPVVCPAPGPAANQQPFQPSVTNGNGGEVLGSAIVPPTQIVDAGNPVFFPFAGITTGNNLVLGGLAAPNIDPANVFSQRPVTGLPAGETIVGSDFRPATNQLYALSNTGRLYIINLATGEAVRVGTSSLPLSGTGFGFDFNPVADVIRIVSDTGQNLRVNPNTGALIATDTSITGGTNISAAAYTNNSPFATSTTLYVIDPISGNLYIQDPNAGTLTLVGPLGVTATNVNGFDIVTSGGTQVAVAELVVAGVPNVYFINLATGTATLFSALPAPAGGFALAPADLGPNAPRGVISTNNVGGGYATVRVIEGSAAAETVLDFFNRSNPGTVKVCKIAGPGIPLGTLFRFSVFGPFGTTDIRNPDTAPNSPQFSVYGPVAQIVDVTAGDPATGGNCILVPGLGQGVGRTEFQTFLNGTPVLVVENGISPANTVPVPPGAIRVSRIRVFGPATGTLVLQSGTGAATIGPNRAGFTPNQCLGFSATNNCSATNGLATAANNFNASGDTTPDPPGFDGRNPGNVTPVVTPRLGRVAFNQRPGEVVAEFTNFIFNPTLLKVCKIAGGTLAPGGTFTFDVTLTNGGPVSQPGGVPLFPGNPTSTVSVTSARNEAATPFGNCDFVDGAAFPGGQFNIGEPVTITERTATGTTVVRCDSPTNGGFLFPATGAPVVNRQCGFTAGGMIAGVNIVAFTNGPTAPEPDQGARTAFDFDGDGKADPSIYRPSTGTWSYAASSASNEIRSTRWGISADIAVAADYDGDRKSDLAVFRSGTWYIMGSAGAFRGEAFGSPGDIPQPGDYDGDGRADLAVFRPSNGTWYMLGSTKGFTAVQFGVSTDKPVAADYDGDGKTDQAVYRNGAWYMNNSKTGFAGVNWGLATDIPVPADYTGDGKADLTVYRNGNWYTLNENGTFSHKNWGTATDKPVPADYDGDRKADIAVYRNGMWYALPTTNSAQGFTSVSLGNESDTPVPASLR
jgi:hypothetical protein